MEGWKIFHGRNATKLIRCREDPEIILPYSNQLAADIQKKTSQFFFRDITTLDFIIYVNKFYEIARILMSVSHETSRHFSQLDMPLWMIRYEKKARIHFLKKTGRNLRRSVLSCSQSHEQYPREKSLPLSFFFL